jgi:hypothetical protein
VSFRVPSILALEHLNILCPFNLYLLMSLSAVREGNEETASSTEKREEKWHSRNFGASWRLHDNHKPSYAQIEHEKKSLQENPVPFATVLDTECAIEDSFFYSHLAKWKVLFCNVWFFHMSRCFLSLHL